jgi:hypothetical protein
MRFMVIVPTTPATEDHMPSGEMLTAMGEFNKKLIDAGVMLAGEGLRASRFGAKLTFTGKQKATPVDGPFTEAKELVGGFWIIQAASKEEAIRLMSEAPFPAGVTLEIRRLAEVEDFADFREDLAEDERKWREKSGYAAKS